VFAWGLAFALGVALVGALYPAWRAVRLTPIDALRRE
jgi:ABC-type antimicrobial peptide transport system permease subunit